MATTFEAIIAAIYKDSGFDALDTVRGVVDRLGFFEHPFFSVTYCDSRTLALINIQMIINLRCLDPG